jgi:hypothetical protein
LEDDMGEAKRRRLLEKDADGNVVPKEGVRSSEWKSKQRILKMCARDIDFETFTNVVTLFAANVCIQSVSLENPAARDPGEAYDIGEAAGRTVAHGVASEMLSPLVHDDALAFIAAAEDLYAFVRSPKTASMPHEKMEKELGALHLALRTVFNTKLSPLATRLDVKRLYRTVPWGERCLETVMTNLLALPEAERDSIHAILFPEA